MSNFEISIVSQCMAISILCVVMIINMKIPLDNAKKRLFAMYIALFFEALSWLFL